MSELINHSLLQMTNENGESTGILYPQNDGTDVSIDTSKNSSIPANVSNVQDLTNNLGGAAFLPSSDITNLQDDVTTLQNQAKGIILSVPEANWSTSGSGYVNTLTINGITGNETLTASLYDTGSLTEAEITTFDEIITKMETKTNQIVLTASEKPTVSFSIVLTGEFSINNQGFSNLGDVQKSIDTVNNRVTVVNSRINSLATLTEGSTTGDAELMDIRNGANGVTYDSAGDAVRGQVTEIKEDLVHKKYFIIENKELTEVSNTINIDLPLNRKAKKVEITNGSDSAGYYSFNIYNNDKTTFLLGQNVLINANETKIFKIPNIKGTTLLCVNTNQRENSKISFYYDIDKTIDELSKYTTTVTVSQFGEGDFTKIEDAIEFLKENYDVKNTPTTIYIKRGIYIVEPTNEYPFSPLNKGANKISIIGEDMYGVVIKCTNTSTRQSKVLNIGGECIIKNLSIYCLNDGTYTLENDLGHNAYCIHNDEEYETEKKYKTVIENVYMYSECHAPLGGGLRDKQEQIYKNVVLNANGLVGAGFYVHGPSDPNVMICEINIDNVTAECNTGARAIDLSPVPNCLNFTEIPTTITRSIFITNGTDKGTTDFKVHHKLTKVSCLNNDSELNY